MQEGGAHSFLWRGFGRGVGVNEVMGEVFGDWVGQPQAKCSFALSAPNQGRKSHGSDWRNPGAARAESCGSHPRLGRTVPHRGLWVRNTDESEAPTSAKSPWPCTCPPPSAQERTPWPGAALGQSALEGALDVVYRGRRGAGQGQGRCKGRGPGPGAAEEPVSPWTGSLVLFLHLPSGFQFLRVPELVGWLLPEPPKSQPPPLPASPQPAAPQECIT